MRRPDKFDADESLGAPHRTLALPRRCAEALREHRVRQAEEPLARVRPGWPASVVWSLRVQMIRSPGLAWVPSAMVTAGLF